MSIKLKSLALSSLLVVGTSLPCPCLPNTFKAVVKSVADGDTLWVTSGKDTVKVRLSSIDCPESTQKCGNTAKATTEHLCLGQQVTVTFKKRDMYGRYLGQVFLQNDTELNQMLVQSGFAWYDFKNSSPKRPELAEDEKKAREQKIGLWFFDDPIQPWCFRALKRLKGCNCL